MSSLSPRRIPKQYQQPRPTAVRERQRAFWERLPGWLLPIVGGLVFAVLTALWLTSALWFFRTFGVTT